MRTHIDDGHRPSDPIEAPGSHGRLVTVALLVIAIFLAVSFFYMTNEKRRDRPAESVTKAAAAVDDAARRVGHSARDAAQDIRKNP